MNRNRWHQLQVCSLSTRVCALYFGSYFSIQGIIFCAFPPSAAPKKGTLLHADQDTERTTSENRGRTGEGGKNTTKTKCNCNSVRRSADSVSLLLHRSAQIALQLQLCAPAMKEMTHHVSALFQFHFPLRSTARRRGGRSSLSLWPTCAVISYLCYRWSPGESTKPLPESLGQCFCVSIVCVCVCQW